MLGKTVVITGATSGIGEVAALRLAERGARMVLVARDPVRARATIARLASAGPECAHAVYFADLAVLAEQRRVGAEIAANEPRIDVLINNAGALTMRPGMTVDGLAPTFSINHLAYYVLTLLLLPRLQASPEGRIVCTASRAHMQGHMDFNHLQRDGMSGYAQSKLANLLFVRRLAQLLAASSTTVNALHPGFVATRFADNGGSAWRALVRSVKALTAISAEEGALTLMYLAQSVEVAGRSGGYYVRCALAQPGTHARNDPDALRLWEISAQLTGVDFQPATASA
ncbi:MAG TPA: SDR family NAD(P)-dependent oxidoreductase [Steroidobacteraceae bacterium]|nr:SDR family NAD(P)-dependent oxidoreductase [Steroidobacteraceae bacterium]